MKRLLAVIGFVFVCAVVHAQESNSLLFRIGLGTFSMSRQKEFQQDFKNSINIPLRTVYSFPAYPTFGGSIGIRTSSNSAVGLWVEYASTGGRLSYKDYSGYIRMDQLLNYFQGGPFFQYRVNKSNSWPVYINILASTGRTNQKLISEFEVGGQFEREEYNLRSINYGLRPGIMLSHNMRAILVQIGLGAEFQLHGDLKDINDRNILFKTSSGKNINAQWDGIRLTCGLGFQFGKALSD